MAELTSTAVTLRHQQLRKTGQFSANHRFGNPIRKPWERQQLHENAEFLGFDQITIWLQYLYWVPLVSQRGRSTSSDSRKVTDERRFVRNRLIEFHWRQAARRVATADVVTARNGDSTKEMNVVGQTLVTEISIDRFERLLWRVLGQLARDGYVVPPSEARDLIHDFYAEGLQGLAERYDPKKGSFIGYVYGAFYRFARRRVLRLQTWRSRLTDVRNLAQCAADSPTPEEIVDLKEQVAMVRKALSRLPERQRSVLHDFLSGEETSERQLALKHGISRYRLREMLIDALGHVAIDLGCQPRETTIDGQVALALWRDGRTVRDTAALLGVSVAEVHAARKRSVAQLLVSIRSQQPSQV